MTATVRPFSHLPFPFSRHPPPALAPRPLHEQVVQALGDLYIEKHDYKTVVIDSLDWLERLI